jgi:hypothetical protein
MEINMNTEGFYDDNKSNINEDNLEHDLEYDNYYDNEENNITNYWEPITNHTKPIKKVSFPDILLNMNLIVKNGVLQQIGPLHQNKEYTSYDNNASTILPTYHGNQDYIYNKYFKDYHTMNEPIEVKKPKTLEEYKLMLLEDRIKRIQEVQRISTIKSKKLIFTESNVIKPSVNHLRKMTFS